MHANPSAPSITLPAPEGSPSGPPSAKVKEICGAPSAKGIPCPNTVLMRQPDPDGKRRCTGHAINFRARQKANGAHGKVAAHLKARKQRELDEAAISIGEQPLTPPPPKRPAVDLSTADGWREQVGRVVADVLAGSINPGQASAALAGMRLLLDERSKAPEETDDRLDALLERLK